jgi:hypothetical protein
MTTLLLLLSGPAVAQDAAILSDYIELEAPLDQPAGEFYCADVVGMDVDVDLRVQSHTCKAPRNDQLFTVNTPRMGNVYVTEHDLCVEARIVTEGAELYTAECRRSPTQRWRSTPDGQIHPASDASLCWTVNPGPTGDVAGGGNLKRTLTLRPCADFRPEYNTWVIPGGSIGM